MDYIKKDFQLDINSKSLFVLLPGWHAKLKNYKIVKNKILNSGHSFLGYEFAEEILSSNAERTNAKFKEIKEVIRKDITELTGKYGFQEINFIGLSLGSILALMIANGLDKVGKIILITTTYGFAQSIWEGARTKQIRKELESQRKNLQKVDEIWNGLSPQNNISNLRAKEIYILLSKTDRVLPYSHGRKLVEVMQSQGLFPKVSENSYFGHYLTIANYMLFPRL